MANVSIKKNGIVLAKHCYESDGMNTISINSVIAYTPVKDTNNSCANSLTWSTPEGTVTGDIFRLQALVEYSGFDSSSTAGTFKIRFQGDRWDSANQTWTWSGGTQRICNTLNSQKDLTTLVLSSTKGTYLYDALFSVPEDNVTTYTKQHISIRTDYSNGVGIIKVSQFRIIPEKYSVSTTPPLIRARLGQNYIATDELIEI